jgi:hypothetical protein
LAKIDGQPRVVTLFKFLGKTVNTQTSTFGSKRTTGYLWTMTKTKYSNTNHTNDI